MLALVAQNAMGFIDAVMVSHLGDAALASIGIGNFIIILFLTIPLGIGAGTQVVIARRVGEGNQNILGSDLNLGLIVACFSAALMYLLCKLVAPHLIAAITESDLVLELGMNYVDARLLSIMFIAAFICFRAFWSGKGIFKPIIEALYLMLLFNVIFNYMFIFGHLGAPRLGIYGAGLASALAAFVCMCFILIRGWRTYRQCGFGSAVPSIRQLQTLIKVSLPECMNLFFISIAVLVLFFIVGQLGVVEMAILHVLVNFILFAHLVVESLGLSAITLVGQSLGRTEYDVAKTFGWLSATVGACFVSLVGIMLVLIPESILSLFFDDPISIEVGTIPMQLLGTWIWIDVYAKVISFALIGAGATKTVLMIMFVLYWCLGIPSQWLLGVRLKYELAGVFFVPLIVTLLSSLMFSIIWHRGHWKKIMV